MADQDAAVERMEEAEHDDYTRRRAWKRGKPALIEALAALEHEQWQAWAHGILATEKLSSKRQRRWARLFIRSYDQLTEQEKEQDRIWARKVLAIVEAHG